MSRAAAFCCLRRADKFRFSPVVTDRELPAEPSGPISLQVRRLRFSYDGAQILFQGLSFDAEAASVIGVVGPSGCGKSTLLKILSGLIPCGSYQDSASAVLINGAYDPVFLKTRKRISYVFQQPTLLPYLDVRSNIELPVKISKRQAAIPVDDLIGMVGLRPFAHYLPQTLSGGMKTRVALARGFATGPALLLLDEPFGSLDPSWRFRLYAELLAFKIRFNTTVVLVTHNTQEAVLLCDRVIVLDQAGRLVHERSIAHAPRPAPTAAGLLSEVESLESDILSIEQILLKGVLFEAASAQ